MSLVLTSYGYFNSAISQNQPVGTVYRTSGFTPHANALLVVVQSLLTNAGSSDPSANMQCRAVKDSDHSAGVALSNRGLIGDASFFASGLTIWTGQVGGSPVAYDIESEDDSDNWSQWKIWVGDLTGHNSGSPIGASGTNGSLAKSGADHVTLGGAPVASSMSFGATYIKLPGTNFAGAPVAAGDMTDETSDSDAAANQMLLDVIVRTGSTSTSVGWSNMYNGASLPNNFPIGLALEIKAAASVGRLLLLG